MLYIYQIHGICHRDIKPANILVNDNDDFMLADVGTLKKISSNNSRVNMQTIIKGSPTYMSPEFLEYLHTQYGMENYYKVFHENENE